jgi:hypothetical protein
VDVSGELPMEVGRESCRDLSRDLYCDPRRELPAESSGEAYREPCRDLHRDP